MLGGNLSSLFSWQNIQSLDTNTIAIELSRGQSYPEKPAKINCQKLVQPVSVDGCKSYQVLFFVEQVLVMGPKYRDRS